MFMKTAPEEIDPQKHPELACLQAIIHDEDRSPAGKWTLDTRDIHITKETQEFKRLMINC